MRSCSIHICSSIVHTRKPENRRTIPEQQTVIETKSCLVFWGKTVKKYFFKCIQLGFLNLSPELLEQIKYLQFHVCVIPTCLLFFSLDLDFCKSGQMRSPDFHIHPQQNQQQRQEEEEEVLRSGPVSHVHSRTYSLGVGSDVDTEPEVDPSPAHGLQHMWMRGLKSEQSSCLTSRANSALSLTDTEHDRKSEPDNGESTWFQFPLWDD